MEEKQKGKHRQTSVASMQRLACGAFIIAHMHAHRTSFMNHMNDVQEQRKHSSARLQRRLQLSTRHNSKFAAQLKFPTAKSPFPQFLRRMLLLKKIAAMSEDDLQHLFQKQDKNSDGVLSQKEFSRVMKNIVRRKLQPNELSLVLHSIDTDQNGGVGIEELLKFTRPSSQKDQR